MSYCRWSTNDFQCDVYVYEHVHGGFMIHVASNRTVFAGPLPAEIPLEKENIVAFIERQQKVMEMVDAAESRPIGLPYDGKNFLENDAASCADRLETLKSIGYLVPQFAIDSLREEAAEGGEA